MILNIYTIVMVFVAGVSLVLGVTLLCLTLRAVLRHGASPSLDLKSAHEKEGYLIFLLACVVLSVRMLAWPWFYFMLQSFVMEVPGAMCMYGVTQILPTTVQVLQILKPVSFFVTGGWMLGCFLNKNIATAPLTRRLFLYLIPVSAILLIDSAAEIYYVLHMKPLISVSCCATVFDLPFRASAMVPEAIFGADYKETLLVLYYGMNLVLLSLLTLSFSKKRAIASWSGTVGYGRLIAVIINAFIVYVSFREVIGPRLMQRPLHHCLYCFIGNGMVPDAPIMLALFVLGSFAVGWMATTRMICGKTDAEPALSIIASKVKRVSVFCFLSFVIMVTVHLVFV